MAVDPTSLWREPEVAPWDPVRPPALELVDVFRIFRAGPVETVALRGLSLRIEPGEFVAVLGPSGCGKSTMLALAAGLDAPTAGEVRIDGRSLARLDEDGLASVRAGTVAVVLQDDNLWTQLTPRENVELGLRLAGRHRREVTSAAHDALARFGLDGRADQAVHALSGGEQVRVAVAAAYARRPKLVLADEPTAELDSGNERRVLGAFGELRSGADSAVLVVTHSGQVARAADRVIELADGKARR